MLQGSSERAHTTLWASAHLGTHFACELRANALTFFSQFFLKWQLFYFLCNSLNINYNHPVIFQCRFISEIHILIAVFQACNSFKGASLFNEGNIIFQMEGGAPYGGHLLWLGVFKKIDGEVLHPDAPPPPPPPPTKGNPAALHPRGNPATCAFFIV